MSGNRTRKRLDFRQVQISDIQISDIYCIMFAPENNKLGMPSMECSLMVSIVAFGPGDPSSNPSWCAVLNSNQKLSFHE